MKNLNTMKRMLAGVLAMLTVAVSMPANVNTGGLFDRGTEIVAKAVVQDATSYALYGTQTITDYNFDSIFNNNLFIDGTTLVNQSHYTVTLEYYETDFVNYRFLNQEAYDIQSVTIPPSQTYVVNGNHAMYGDKTIDNIDKTATIECLRFYSLTLPEGVAIDNNNSGNYFLINNAIYTMGTSLPMNSDYDFSIALTSEKPFKVGDETATQTEGVYTWKGDITQDTVVSLLLTIAPQPVANLKYDSTEKELVSALTWLDGKKGTVYYGIGEPGEVIEQGNNHILTGDDLTEGKIFKPNDLDGYSFPEGYSIKLNNTTYAPIKDSNDYYYRHVNVYYNGQYNCPYNIFYGAPDDASDVYPLSDGNDALRIDKIDTGNNIIEVTAVNSANVGTKWGEADTLPTATDVGTYPVYYKITSTDASYAGLEATKIADVKIDKGDSLVKAPTAKNPTHSSSAVQLINAGTVAKDCTMYYLVADEKPASDDTKWSTDIPTADASGTYAVWYKVTGNSNYEDTAVCENPVTVTVSQYTAPVSTKSYQTFTVHMNSYVYDGTAHDPIIHGTPIGKVTYTYYDTDTETKLTAAPSAVGNYRVSVRANGDSIYYSRVQKAEYSITEPSDSIDENSMANVENFKNNNIIPEAEGKVFAGWYTDETCTTPYKENSGKAYAKFIDKNILTVKAQISSGTTANSEKTSIRFITSVDSLKYKNIGFKITYNGKTIDQQLTKVYTVINANGSKVNPSVFSTEAHYMGAYVLNNIPNSAFSKEFTVTPYYTTQDGTIVDGETRTFIIFNMIK